MSTRVVLSIAAFGLSVMAAFAIAPQTARAGGPPVIDASPDSDTNLVGTDHTITAVVTQDGGLAPNWEVTFDVLTGPNAGDAGTDVSDGNGEASFTYTGDGGAGQDDIEVCITQFVGNGIGSTGNGPIDCQTVTKTWEDPTPTPTPVPSATPTATPVATAPAAELPDTGAQPGNGGGFPWAGAIALALGGAAALVGGAALLKRAR